MPYMLGRFATVKEAVEWALSDEVQVRAQQGWDPTCIQHGPLLPPCPPAPDPHTPTLLLKGPTSTAPHTHRPALPCHRSPRTCRRASPTWSACCARWASAALRRAGGPAHRQLALLPRRLHCTRGAAARTATRSRHWAQGLAGDAAANPEAGRQSNPQALRPRCPQVPLHMSMQDATGASVLLEFTGARKVWQGEGAGAVPGLRRGRASRACQQGEGAGAVLWPCHGSSQPLAAPSSGSAATELPPVLSTCVAGGALGRASGHKRPPLPRAPALDARVGGRPRVSAAALGHVSHALLA